VPSLKKRSTIIVVERTLVKSRAWLSLRGMAPQVYLIFRTKCQVTKPPGKRGKRDWIISNNGEIVFTYDEAQRKHGISRGQFKRAIDGLVAKGFIDIEATGMGVHKVTTYYAMSERWRDYGTARFRSKKRPIPTIPNPGFKKGNELWKRRGKNSSAENVHGAVRTNNHGRILVMRTDRHGQKICVRYNLSGRRWISQLAE